MKDTKENRTLQHVIKVQSTAKHSPTLRKRYKTKQTTPAFAVKYTKQGRTLSNVAINDTKQNRALPTLQSRAQNYKAKHSCTLRSRVQYKIEHSQCCGERVPPTLRKQYKTKGTKRSKTLPNVTIKSTKQSRTLKHVAINRGCNTKQNTPL